MLSPHYPKSLIRAAPVKGSGGQDSLFLYLDKRKEADAWGPAIRTAQEVPACYFTRGFGRFESYLGNNKWRRERQPPGPPWGRAKR